MSTSTRSALPTPLEGPIGITVNHAGLHWNRLVDLLRDPKAWGSTTSTLPAASSRPRRFAATARPRAWRRIWRRMRLPDRSVHRDRRRPHHHLADDPSGERVL